MLLRDRVPDDCAPHLLYAIDGQNAAQRGLDVKAAPSFPASQRWCQHGAWPTVLVGAGWNATAEKCSQDVVALLLIGGEDAIFHQEADIAGTIHSALLGVLQIGRRVEQQFDMGQGNQPRPFPLS